MAGCGLCAVAVARSSGLVFFFLVCVACVGCAQLRWQEAVGWFFFFSVCCVCGLCAVAVARSSGLVFFFLSVC
jgi:hypothetical protein